MAESLPSALVAPPPVRIPSPGGIIPTLDAMAHGPTMTTAARLRAAAESLMQVMRAEPRLSTKLSEAVRIIGEVGAESISASRGQGQPPSPPGGPVPPTVLSGATPDVSAMVPSPLSPRTM